MLSAVILDFMTARWITNRWGNSWGNQYVVLSKEEIDALRTSVDTIDKIVNEATETIGMESLARQSYNAGVRDSDETQFQHFWADWLKKNRMR